MAASRRAQVRALCGARSGPLVDRAESYLSAVDLWSVQGNAKVVKSVGSGLVAVCSWLAAERSAAERASGLTPLQFRNAERDLRPALQGISSPGPSTPSKNRIAPSPLSTPSQRSSGSAVSTPSAKKQCGEDTRFDPNDRSPEALRAKAQAAQSGSLFSRSASVASNVSTPRSARFHDHFRGGSSMPHTPTRSSPLKRTRYIAHAIPSHPVSRKQANDDAKEQFSNGDQEQRLPYAESDAQAAQEPEVVEQQVSNTVKAMRNVLTGLGTRSRRTDTHDLQSRLDNLRDKLVPLLEKDAATDTWDSCSPSRSDLFVWLPLGSQQAQA